MSPFYKGECSSGPFCVVPYGRDRFIYGEPGVDARTDVARSSEICSLWIAGQVATEQPSSHRKCVAVPCGVEGEDKSEVRLIEQCEDYVAKFPLLRIRNAID